MRKKPWPGGYIREEADGRETFIIERRVNTKRFHVSTRAHNWTAAMKQLARFEADPRGYRPEGEEKQEPLNMTRKLVLEHRDASIAKGNTAKHANEMAHRLNDWVEDLAGRDLRHLTGLELRELATKRATSLQHRIIAIKSFFAWLRREKGMLIHAQDASLDLAVPQARPERAVKRKAVSAEVIAAAAGRLRGPYRDCLELLAATGWHVSELGRFIREKTSRVVVTGKTNPLAVLMTRHKTGVMTRTPLNDPDHLEAALRLHNSGTVPRKLNAHLRQACKEAGVEEFTFGVMRHSVATIAVERGATPDQVAAFLHHRDKRTTEKFYVDVAEPTNQVPVLRLVR